MYIRCKEQDTVTIEKAKAWLDKFDRRTRVIAPDTYYNYFTPDGPGPRQRHKQSHLVFDRRWLVPLPRAAIDKQKRASCRPHAPIVI